MALVYALLPSFALAAACPPGFEGPSGDACFSMSGFAAPFSSCEEHCESQHATLASIRSSSENEWVRKYLGDRPA